MRGSPGLLTLAISARTDRKRFPHRFCRNLHFSPLHSQFQLLLAVIFLANFRISYVFLMH